MRRPPAPLPVWLIGGIVVVALIASAVVGTLVFWAVRTTWSQWNGGGQGGPVLSIPGLGGITGGGESTPTNGWQCGTWSNRVTVLVMGIDQRKEDKEQDAPTRTDTMIVLSLDPADKTAAMVSIPRDLWVTIPDYGYGRTDDRINTANVYGDLYKYPGGGAGLAVKTVQLNLGIQVDHYVRLNFSAFEDFIDEIGGIDVDVPVDIYDAEYPTPDYGVEVFQISKGTHHLDGATALKYARTRHQDNDFGRAKRQQQVIMAVRDKITNLKMVPQLLPKLPEMYSNFKESVSTDISANELVCLALISQDIPRDNIRSGVIDESYTTNWTTPQGAQVLVPERQKIGELLAELYAPPATPVASTPDRAMQIAHEGARIVVRNGTLTAGLASKTADYLRSLNLNVVDAANADRFDYQETRIVDYTGKPYTTRYLAELFGVQNGNILSGSNPSNPVDIEIILGNDVETQH